MSLTASQAPNPARSFILRIHLKGLQGLQDASAWGICSQCWCDLQLAWQRCARQRRLVVARPARGDLGQRGRCCPGSGAKVSSNRKPMSEPPSIRVPTYFTSTFTLLPPLWRAFFVSQLQGPFPQAHTQKPINGVGELPSSRIARLIASLYLTILVV